MNEVNHKNSVNVSEFSLRFRLLMGYHNLTLRDIAEYTHSAVSTVGTWKNGRMPTSSVSLSRLAEIFQVSEEFLVHGRSESEEPINPHVLSDIEGLLDELEHDGPNEPQVNVGEDRDKSSSSPANRQALEAYFHAFLKEAEQHPCGLAHVWYQLRREFPHDLFRKLRRLR